MLYKGSSCHVFLLLCFLLSPAFFQPINAQNLTPLVLKPNEPVKLIGKQVQVIEDKDAKMSIQDILKKENQQKFKVTGKKVFFQPATNSAFWFKITVENQTQEQAWLKTGDSFGIWYLDFYAPNSEGKYHQPLQLGALRPQQNNQFPSSFYCVPLSKVSTPQTYYLRIESQTGINIAFELGSGLSLTKKLKNYDYLFAIYLGVILTVIIYNLFVYFSTRAFIYLIYIFMLISIVPPMVFAQGRSFFNGAWWWNNMMLWVNFTFVFQTLFVVTYLKLSVVSKRLTFWLWGLTITLSVIFPLIDLLGVTLVDYISAYQGIILIYDFSLLIIGIYVWRKGFRNARFYILAWVFYIISVFVFIFMANGLIEFNILTSNALYLGNMLEQLMFAFALGDRLNTLKREKEEVTAKNLQLIQEQNQTLAQKVTEKTQELQDAYEETQVMNEELQQGQEEIAAQRDVLEAKNLQLTRYQQRIGQSIRAAELIQHVTLPSQNQLKRYFQDFFVLYRPKDVVSGDFYWIGELNQKKIIVAADCTGHGVPGAFMTLIGNVLLDKIINIHKVDNPALILTQLHEEVVNFLHQKETDNSNGMDAVVLTIENNQQSAVKVEFAGAKNSLLYVDNQDMKIQELSGTRKAIGGYQPTEIHFKTNELYLPKGGILYIGSDGLSDQNNVKRKRFGKKRLINTLEQIMQESFQEQKKLIEEKLNEFMQETEQRDDILWLGLKV